MNTTASKTRDGKAALEAMKCGERQALAADLWKAVIDAPEGSRERAEAKAVWRWAHDVWSGRA
jgi:hypothetical protein